MTSSIMLIRQSDWIFNTLYSSNSKIFQSKQSIKNSSLFANTILYWILNDTIKAFEKGQPILTKEIWCLPNCVAFPGLPFITMLKCIPFLAKIHANIFHFKTTAHKAHESSSPNLIHPKSLANHHYQYSASTPQLHHFTTTVSPFDLLNFCG